MTGVPTPGEDLLAPLLEAAADTLRGLEPGDVPLSLRHLAGFDRRGLVRGPARRQLLRALEDDDAFRARAVEAFAGRPEVAAVLAAWEPGGAAAAAAAAAGRGDLALLASALWAARPGGWEYGLGAVAAEDARAREARGGEAALASIERRATEVEEARRRAEAARIEAQAESARLAGALRDERRSRRAREEQAEAAAEAAGRRAEGLEAAAAQARAAAAESDRRAEREARRARALEEEAAGLRRDLATARAALAADAERAAAPPESTLVPADALALADAAAFAARLAAALGVLAGRFPPPRAPAPPARPPASPPPTRRVRPPLPPGLVADTPRGAEAMLRGPGVVLVVDGYNLSQRAWPDATPSEQRARLAGALAQFHLRVGCETTLVFDGDGTVGVPPIRRPGLRVLFSARGEEADEVVVREAGARPKDVPVVVASSDRWVREHAEEAGAVPVSADTLLHVLQVRAAT